MLNLTKSSASTLNTSGRGLPYRISCTYRKILARFPSETRFSRPFRLFRAFARSSSRFSVSLASLRAVITGSSSIAGWVSTIGCTSFLTLFFFLTSFFDDCLSGFYWWTLCVMLSRKLNRSESKPSLTRSLLMRFSPPYFSEYILMILSSSVSSCY